MTLSLRWRKKTLKRARIGVKKNSFLNCKKTDLLKQKEYSNTLYNSQNNQLALSKYEGFNFFFK